MAAGLTLRLLLLALLVAALHWATLEWAHTQLPRPSSLPSLAPVMFTREIAPTPPLAQAPSPTTPPPQILKPKRQVAGKKPAQAAIESIARALPEATPTLPEPSPSPPPEAAAAVPPIENASTPPSTPTASTSALVSNTTVVGRWQDIWPESTRISYKAGGYFRGELFGNAVVQWQLQGEQYQTDVVVDIGPITALKMRSQGRITPEGLHPQAYEETELGTRRVVGLPDEAVVLGNGQRVPRVAGVQDSASQFVELAFRLLTGRDKLEVGQVIRYTMARPDGVDEWVYDVVAEDTLQTPRWGPIQAFHLKPRPLARPRGPIVMETWYAPSLDYLPVRIKVFRGTTSYIDLVIDNALRAKESPPATRAPAPPPFHDRP